MKFSNMELSKNFVPKDFAPKGLSGHFLEASRIRKLPKEPWFLGKAAGQDFSQKQVEIFYERPSQGALAIEVFFLDSPFGLAAVGFSERGLCRLDFPASVKEAHREYERYAASLHGRIIFQNSSYKQGRRSKALRAVLDLMEKGSLQHPFSLHLPGSPFQCLVWNLLLRIPRGCVTSYGELARALGRSGSARAVGGAVAKNPVSFLIPCHRVIPASRRLGNYHWGSQKKAALLESEGGWRPEA